MCLYNIAIYLYSLLIKIGSLWIPKAKLWCDGRRDIFSEMRAVIAPTDRVLWIHVASLGEFEQGRPLIEKIRAEHPDYKILLTFFSPSGYELRKNYSGADYIFYLPSDTPRNARRFLDIAHPEVVIIVKYEFWLNMLFELRRRSIRSFIVSSIFRSNSIFFRPYGHYWRRALRSFETIFVQNEESKSRLAQIEVNNVVVAGDTRFDRVAQIAKSAKVNPTIECFKGTTPLMVAGSTWPADEEILRPIIEANRDIKFVIAPHEIDSARTKELQQQFKGSIRYTEINDESDLRNTQVLILDTMGHLSSIYSYGKWAYIGGGFGVGIHNTLEAATFGLPMAFGPNYLKFKEACEMIELGACRSISNLEQAQQWFDSMRHDEELYQKAHKITKEYIATNQGASKIITETIFS